MKKFTLALLALLVVSACNKPAESAANADPLMLGKADAKITMEEYAALFCPGCAPIHKEGFDKLKAEYIDTGVVKYKFNNIPMNPAAVNAGLILGCSKQEDYYKTVSAFFAADQKWPQPKPQDMAKSKNQHPQIDFITPVKDVASKLGFTEEAFNTCVGNQEAAKKMQEEGRALYEKLGLTKSPSFIINGVKVDWVKTYDDLKKAIEMAKAGKNPNEEYDRAILENLKITTADHVMGNPQAPNVLFEYASLSCSHCADFATKEFPQIKAQLIDTGKLLYVYRNFPLNKPALIAAKVAECAPKDKYFDLLDVLFVNQSKWAFDKDFEPKLQGFTKDFGIDYAKCTADAAVEKQLLETMQQAQDKLDIGGTPTLFLNGKKFSSHKLADITKAIK